MSNSKIQTTVERQSVCTSCAAQLVRGLMCTTERFRDGYVVINHKCASVIVNYEIGAPEKSKKYFVFDRCKQEKWVRTVRLFRTPSPIGRGWQLLSRFRRQFLTVSQLIALFCLLLYPQTGGTGGPSLSTWLHALMHTDLTSLVDIWMTHGIAVAGAYLIECNVS